MPPLVILNPAAGGGRAARHAARIEAAFVDAGSPAELRQTAHPSHAVDLAREARHVGRLVVAAGGDGTIHEVVRGLTEDLLDSPADEPSAALGLLPIGTGNDFASLFALPKRLLEAVRALLDPSVETAVDVGVVTWSDAGGTHTRVFCNAVGLGFDAAAAHAATGTKHLPGVLGYLVAVRRTLVAWRSPVVQIEADGSSTAPAPLLLLMVGNGRRSGGGFYLTPRADVSDGLLDVCAVADAPTRRVLRLLPGVLLGGRHEGEPEVTTARVRTLTARAVPPVPLHADGEMLSLAASSLTVCVRPAALRIRATVR